jgi:hypothetical protein
MKFLEFIKSLFSKTSVVTSHEEEKMSWYETPASTLEITEEVTPTVEPITEEVHLAPETAVITTETKPKKKKPYRRKNKKSNNVQ